MTPRPGPNFRLPARRQRTAHLKTILYIVPVGCGVKLLKRRFVVECRFSNEIILSFCCKTNPRICGRESPCRKLPIMLPACNSSPRSLASNGRR